MFVAMFIGSSAKFSPRTDVGAAQEAGTVASVAVSSPNLEVFDLESGEAMA
jgi:hypothetical protein